jgi:hypothetical protein
MNIVKSMLRASLRITFFGVLKAALFIYILFLPDSPYVAKAPDGDGFAGVTASKPHESRIARAVLNPDSLAS